MAGEKRYRFVGEGAGIPGLPHELTQAEAETLGVSALLVDALAAGAYKEIRIERPRVPHSGAAPTAEEE